MHTTKNVKSSFENLVNEKIVAKETEKSILKKAIEKVQNMKTIPPICVYNIEPEGVGLSAVDVSSDNQILAGSLYESSDIFVKIHFEKNVSETKNAELFMKSNTDKAFSDDIKNRFYDGTFDEIETCLYGHEFPVTGIKFVHQMNLLISCSLDGTARVWNIEDLSCIAVHSSNKGFYCDIDISKTSSFVACGLNGIIDVFTLDVKQLQRQIIGHTKDVNCVRFHPNGLYFATASYDNTIKLWDTQTNVAVRTFQDDSHSSTIAFSPNGNHLASYSCGRIKLWDLASCRLLEEIIDSEEKSVAKRVHICYDGTGDILISAAVPKIIKIWDIKGLFSEKQNVSQQRVNRVESFLLKSNVFQRRIQFLKFDENNFFTCITK